MGAGHLYPRSSGLQSKKPIYRSAPGYLTWILIEKISFQSFVWLSCLDNETNFLYPIGWFTPWEITDKIFLIKKIDDEEPTFETIINIYSKCRKLILVSTQYARRVKRVGRRDYLEAQQCPSQVRFERGCVHWQTTLYMKQLKPFWRLCNLVPLHGWNFFLQYWSISISKLQNFIFIFFILPKLQDAKDRLFRHSLTDWLTSQNSRILPLILECWNLACW